MNCLTSPKSSKGRATRPVSRWLAMPTHSNILLAEEDPQYAFVLQLALKQAGVPNPVHLVSSRNELIHYLAGEGAYAEREVYPLPSLLLLALRLPRLEDFRALRWIRGRPHFNHIPIVVLSGCEHNGEARAVLEMGADFYQVKPADFAGLVRIVERIRQYWLESRDERQDAA